MATLTLTYNNKRLATYSLAEGRDTSIGRLADNDIIIDNSAVSGRHACVISDQFGFLIKDLDSRNGTFVGKRLVTTRRLVNGDVITLGKHELVFTGEGETSKVDVRQMTRSAPPAEEKSTAFLDTRKHRELLGDVNRLGRREPLVAISYKGKLLYKYLLKTPETTIGRDPSGKIVIDNTAISWQHAVINREGDDFIIRDCKSRNGTVVNNVPVTSHKLQPGDVITLGRHELVFEEQGSFTLEETLQPINKADSSSMYASGTTVINTKRGVPGRGGTFPVLSIVDGGEGEFVVEKKIVTIGKGRDSDLIVKGLLVGQTAAVLATRPDGYYLQYKKGIAKPIVNGRKVKGQVKLQNADLIQIGATILQFNVSS